MEAIILAGGFGTRLKGVLDNIPKPMAPIKGRPFLEYLLDDLILAGFQRVILSVGHLHSTISNHFGEKYKTLELVYSIEDEPLGTGGAIIMALKYTHSNPVFIINGDTLFKINYSMMMENYRENIVDIVIALKSMKDCGRYGTIKISGQNTIIEFREKNPEIKEGLINGGIYLIHKNIFDTWDLPQKFSLEKDFFEKYVHEMNIKVCISEGYFLDIGIPEDYKRAQYEF